ncbi:hypothetical protein [Pleomorphovibrio marinus]|uniref:hypothetical protein n=1 Tax=Pleomorphovibrio marinus TaxID=2164132 RepID=UPI0018E55768|nr:hypothetical protein [Pleomorphovibrio marinus]
MRSHFYCIANVANMNRGVLALFMVFYLFISCNADGDRPILHVIGEADGDLATWLSGEGFKLINHSNPAIAMESIEEGGVLFVLAEGYPYQRVELSEAFFEDAEIKGLRLYVEYPDFIPGVNLQEEALQTRLERGVVNTDVFGLEMQMMSILGINDCHVIPSDATNPLLVLAKVAGLDKAEYGIDDVETHPLLIEENGGFYSLTRLSNFAEGRYGPEDHWKALWGYMIRNLTGKTDLHFETWPRYLSPTLDQGEEVTEDHKKESVKRGIDWFYKGRFFIHPDWEDMWQKYQDDGTNPVGPPVSRDLPNGDGSLGLLEGHSSNIYHDGSQQYRYWIRADVQGEGAYAMAAAAKILGNESYRAPAKRLVDYIFNSKLRGGPRSEQDAPTYGLIGWSDTHPGVYYGDDNARAILGVLGASAHLATNEWDKEMMEAILANFRTTGTMGFRDRRLEHRDIIKNGWRYYFDREVINPAPHFESWMWALYLWLYDKTGHEPLLDRAKLAIGKTMDMYPEEWLWTNGIQQERARMILPLAWLVQVEDTPEHREWLDKVVSALLENQMESGAIREELGGTEKGRYGRTKTNAEYGLHEAPLIFENGDPIADMLYTSNFAFFSLNEAAHATGDERYFQALHRLSDFLTRIQVKSERFEDLDGAWFRAFDYDRWEFWASNADVGWGAWGTLTGWTQSWIVATQVLVLQENSYWDLTKQSDIEKHFENTFTLMFAGN